MKLIISKRLHELREKQHMSQSELAQYMNVTRASVNAWEAGISVPTTDKIIELAKIFHTTSDDILGISGKEYVNIEKYNAEEKKLIYKLLNYYDSVHNSLGNKTE